jgi:hypothetical protein
MVPLQLVNKFAPRDSILQCTAQLGRCAAKPVALLLRLNMPVHTSILPGNTQRLSALEFQPAA